MMSRTLGAPLGGTNRGGHQVFDPCSVSLITPPNFGGGAGSCFQLAVVVALGDPNTPVTCCAATGAAASATASTCAATVAATPVLRSRLMLCSFTRPGLRVDRLADNRCE